MFAPLIAKPKPANPQRATIAARPAGQSASALTKAPGVAWAFDTIPTYPAAQREQAAEPLPFRGPPLPGHVQPKLEIGAVDDSLEREADRVADAVMRTPATDGSAVPRVSRSAGGEEEETFRAQPARPPAPVGEAPAIVHQALRSPARPLDTATRVFMESRFGHDFAHVRMHVGAEAAASARALRARAYTAGHDIVHGPGQYLPGTEQGKRLLAHELAHVVQQGASPVRVPAMGGAHEAAAARRACAHRSEGRVQRFTEPGHKLIGDAAFGSEQLTLGEVEMSFGDAVALGDFFGSFDYVRKLASTKGKGRNTKGVLLYVLWEKIHKHKVSKLGEWYDETAVFQADQISRSQDTKNISHFPNPVVGDTALDPLQKNQRVGPDTKPFGAAATYREAHEQAMWMAYINGTRQQSNDDALLADGFACHFLTDSFSASHLRTPRASIKEYWDRKVPGFRNKLIQWLADNINQQPVSEIGPVDLLERGLAPVAVGSTVRGFAVTKLSVLLSGGDFSFGDVVSLIVHDAEGAATVEATIGGKRITLVGDKDLTDERPADPMDPKGDKIYSLKQAGAAADTSEAAIAAVKASLEDIYDAYAAGLPENLGTIGLGYAGFGDLSRTTHHKDFNTFKKGALGRRNLYRAEQLVPTAVDDSLLPAEKKTLPWMKNSVDELLADKRIEAALSVFGKVEVEEFQKRLDEMKDLRPEHRAVIKRVLVDPLASGDANKIRDMFKSILAGAGASLGVGPQGVEMRQPGGGIRISIPWASKRYDL